MKRIILVDDDEEILELMQTILKLAGFTVELYTNGADLQAALHDLPDLIILDINLGQEDGRILCCQLKMDIRTHYVPIILCSAQLNVQKALEESHANSFLTKPFLISDLLRLAQQYTSSTNARSIVWSEQKRK